MRRLCWTCLLTVAMTLALFADDTPPAPTVFDLPRIAAEAGQIAQRLQAALAANDLKAAEEAARAYIGLVPQDSSGPYNLACVLARAGRPDEAFAALGQAVDGGFRRTTTLLADSDLASLRTDPRWAALITRMETAPAPVAAAPAQQVQLKLQTAQDGQVTIEPENTLYANGLFICGVAVDPAVQAALPVLQGWEGQPGWEGLEAEVNGWFAAGTAAGNVGDYYHNHDLDHINMHIARFPQAVRIEYGEAATGKKTATGMRLDTGPQTDMLFTGIVLGNSSTAMTGSPFWRSQPRLIAADPRHVAMLHLQSTKNHLYLYPEHKDHDPGHNGQGGGHGDVYPANTPYTLISQGSSGSEVVHMDALMLTLASFHPDVKRQLAATGLLMPTLQMILRRSYAGIETDADYRTGKAHPTVFDAAGIRPRAMAERAQAMTAADVPPEVRLAVVTEDLGVPGVDYFHPAPAPAPNSAAPVPSPEQLFSTPGAIARVHRSTAQSRRMVVSAEASRDLTGQPLIYDWVILRGDPALITITPLNDAGSRAELRIGWHPRRPIYEGAPIESNRVDIGVFAHNSKSWSAPAFISTFYLDNEDRVYDTDGRIQSIVYHGGTDPGNYVDPLIDMPKTWRDDYLYAPDGADGSAGGPASIPAGALTGWTRTRGTGPAATTEQFTAAGKLLDPTTGVATPVRYLPQREPDKAAILIQQPVPARTANNN